MTALQSKLYAESRHAVLIIFQALDAAGKDSTIKQVMSGINPQGCQVFSFRQPTALELSHDYLWRTTQRLPQRGMIGIFNRSYYEEVLVSRVHPELILKQNLPGITRLEDIPKSLWETRIVKFFLHVSRREQKKRFPERVENPAKNWKIALADAEERACWGACQEACEKALTGTSTKAAPCHIIPADNKWFMRAAVGDILVRTLKDLKPACPAVPAAKAAELARIKRLLLKD